MNLDFIVTEEPEPVSTGKMVKGVVRDFEFLGPRPEGGNCRSKF
jgi:hypothetical protein